MKISEVKGIVESEGKMFYPAKFWGNGIVELTSEELIKRMGDVEVERDGKYCFFVPEGKKRIIFSGCASSKG